MTRPGHSALIPFAAAMLGACAGCAQEARFRHSTDDRAPHAAGSAIEARTDNGSITVSKGPVAEVRVHADVRAVTQERADATVVSSVRQADGTLLVTVNWPDGLRQSNEGCSLTITIPEVVGLRLFTSNGDIDAKGTAGAAVLHTSNGDVVVTDHAGSVEVESSNGEVTLTGIGGAVDARTANGEIDIRGATGAIKTGTSNGGVQITLGPSDAGPLDVRTSNGSIVVRIGPAFAGVVEADTSNGSVDVSGGPVQIERRGRGHATFTFGEGGAGSTLTTSNGSVTVMAAK